MDVIKKLSESEVLGSLNWLCLKLCMAIRSKGKNNQLVRCRKSFAWFNRINIIGDNNSVVFGAGSKLRRLKIKIIGNNNSINLGDKTRVYEKGSLTIEGNNSVIKIGDRTTIGSAKLYIGESSTNISIGEDCMLSRDIVIETSDFHSIVSLDTNERINPPKSTVISNHVWIGNGSYLGKGALINDDCIVATRSVVTGKEFPANSIIGGVPAKVIRENITWSREKLPY